MKFKKEEAKEILKTVDPESVLSNCYSSEEFIDLADSFKTKDELIEGLNFIEETDLERFKEAEAANGKLTPEKINYYNEILEKRKMLINKAINKETKYEM